MRLESDDIGRGLENYNVRVEGSTLLKLSLLLP